MYLPQHFAEDRIEVMHGLMREHPFASLISQDADGLRADHLPLHLIADAGSPGVLTGHVARANPVWRHAGNSGVLAIFHGPQAYVTPSWYPAKQEHGKAVPTWNYVVVHARGRLRVIDDAAWLRQQLETLVNHHEAAFAEPWRISDAPPDYIEKMLAAIVGIEITIDHLQGKWKASQNQTAANRAGVVKGLGRQASTDALQMARIVAGASMP